MGRALDGTGLHILRKVSAQMDVLTKELTDLTNVPQTVANLLSAGTMFLDRGCNLREMCWCCLRKSEEILPEFHSLEDLWIVCVLMYLNHILNLSTFGVLRVLTKYRNYTYQRFTSNVPKDNKFRPLSLQVLELHRENVEVSNKETAILQIHLQL